jgi:hypothetical protein
VIGIYVMLGGMLVVASLIAALDYLGRRRDRHRQPHAGGDASHC